MKQKLYNFVKKHLHKVDADFKESDGSISFLAHSKIGSVVICIDIDEDERCLFIGARTKLEIESKKLSKHYELTNKINRFLPTASLILYEEGEMLGAFVNLLFLNELDEQTLEKSIGLCSDTLASFFVAYMMINASDVSVSEAIAAVIDNVGEGD